jgi:hypothetical protein
LLPTDFPLFHFALAKISESHFIWLQKYHHLIIDATGRQLVAARVARIYNALAAGNAPLLTSAPQYRQAKEAENEYLASEQYNADAIYWRARLAEVGKRLVNADISRSDKSRSGRPVRLDCGFTCDDSAALNGTRSERWLFARQAMPSAKVRLFCFPYGGGGASIYRHWQTALGSDVEVCPVQPPGRENRYAEPAIDNINALIDAMLPALHPLFDRPVGFLGYCVGAGVAYSLAARCADRGHLDLRVLISCARRAPAHSSTIDRRHALPDGEFAAYVLSLGGTPRAVF